MQLSKDTIAKLKNFATINPNLVYKGDGRLTTISEVKNILAETNITEDIKSSFGIYDLTEFLSALSLIPDGDVTFTDTAVEIKGGGAKLKYTYADTNILTAPTKTIDMPPADVTVVLTAEQIDAIRKVEARFRPGSESGFGVGLGLAWGLHLLHGRVQCHSHRLA